MALRPVSRARPQSCSTCALHQSFCHFSDEVRAAFDGLKTTVTYWKGETIFHEDDRCQSVFAVCEGSVKLIATSSEGRVLLLRFAQPGEMLGLAEAVLGPTPYECSAIAAESSILAVIPRETFLRFISSYPEAGLGLTMALSQQYRSAQRETKFLGFGDTSTVRLAHLLLEWSAEHGVAGEVGVHIPLHVTHGDLAQAIGATRETVTRQLGQLTRAGLIEQRANAIVVLRPAELARIDASSPVTTNRDAEAPQRCESDVSMFQGPFAPGGTP
jgi:CRP/FNR family transcriptional regulator, cyclic AMP receptor protein